MRKVQEYLNFTNYLCVCMCIFAISLLLGVILVYFHIGLCVYFQGVSISTTEIHQQF